MLTIGAEIRAIFDIRTDNPACYNCGGKYQLVPELSHRLPLLIM